MKDRKNIALAVCFFVSLALYCAMFGYELSGEILDTDLRPVLMLSFHAIPAFCLQALLCRAAKWGWVKFVPLGLLVFVAAVGVAYLSGVVGRGWDTLGGALMLLWCVAPAAGCCLGWMAHGRKIGRWIAAVGWVLLLAVYVCLKILGGPHPFFWYFEVIDIPALAVLIAGIYFLCRGKDKKHGGE